jgi:hypothetical protein
MTNRSAFLIRFVAVLTVLSASVASAQVTWDANGAIAMGSACRSIAQNGAPPPDTFFIAAGEDVSVIFTDFGIDLTEADTESTAVHSCLVRIPITVAPRVALAELTQQLHWGYAKDKETEAEVFASGTFFNLPTRGIRASVGPWVEGVETWLTEEASDTFLHLNGRFCKKQPMKSFLSINLSVSARRKSKSKNISVRVHGEDIKYEVFAKWKRC